MPGFKGEPGIAIRGPKVGFIHVLSFPLCKRERKGDLMHNKLIIKIVLLTVYIDELECKSTLLSFLKTKQSGAPGWLSG